MTGRSATSSAFSSGTPGTPWSAATSSTETARASWSPVLDDGQRGGAGNVAIRHNRVFDNNKFCKKHEETPVDTKGGGILLLGATHTQVTHHPADLIWDHSGFGVRFRHNDCGTSIPGGLCR